MIRLCLVAILAITALQFAEAGEKTTYKLENGIELVVEHPAQVKAEGQRRGIVSSAVGGAAKLAGTVSHETGQFVRGVAHEAATLVRNTAKAGVGTLRRAVNRIRGKSNDQADQTQSNVETNDLKQTPEVPGQAPDELKSSEVDEDSNKLTE